MADTPYNVRNLGETGVIWGGMSIGVTGPYTLQDVDLDTFLNDGGRFIPALETGMAVMSDSAGDFPYEKAVRALKREPVAVGEDTYSEDVCQHATSLAVYQIKINHEFSVRGTGDYLILASALVSSSQPSQKIYVRLYLDDTTVRKEQIMSLIGLKYDDGAFTEYAVMSVADFSTGSHTVKLQYHSSNGQTAYIKEASVIAKRLA